MKSIVVTAVGLVGVLAAVAIYAGASASASDPAPGQAARTVAADDERLERREQQAEALADRLGVERDEVAAALDALRDERFEERLEQAVAAGRLTEDEAGSMRERRAAGECPADGPGRGGAFGRGSGRGQGRTLAP